MHPIRTGAVLIALLIAAAGAVAVAQGKGKGKSGKKTSTTLRDADGRNVGRAEFRQRGDLVTVSVRARDLPPGFHGFHVHAVGACKAPDFKSAMGHLKDDGESHGEHLGDLPSLLVTKDGTAFLTAKTDAFSVRDLTKGDGAALMVHEKPDNFGNIPGRYDPEPDQETRDTGDAGDRIACGEIG